MIARYLSGDDDVVDLEDEAHALRREVDGTRVHEQRHDDVLLQDVGDAPLAHIDARTRLAERMPVAQLGDNLDGVHTGVLRERVRHDLHSLGVGAHAVLVHALEGLRPLGEVVGDLHLRRAAARADEALLDKAAEHAEGIVQRALALVEHEGVGGLAKERDRLARVGHPRDHDDLAVARLLLLDHVCLAQLLRVEGVDVGHGQAAARLRDEVYVVALDVGDHEDLHLCEEVQREVVDGVAQDTLLHEQHVAARRLDLLTHGEDVLPLLLEDAVHLAVVGDDDVLLDVRLGRGEAELDEADLGVGHLAGPARRVPRALREDEAVDERGLVDGAAELLHHGNVVQVDVGGGGRVDDLEDGVDGKGREDVAVVRDDLGVERGRRRLDQLLAVGEVDGHGHVLQDLLRLPGGEQEGLRDDGRVDALLEQDLRLVQQRPGDDRHGRRAVTCLHVLRL
mmetsp:Transcript_27810/g.65685  ORF Transcript_27810/g.65685 Transcript_27810/m.65685 type:complete len:452 (+) Transcript_27810:162-1517(+)